MKWWQGLIIGVSAAAGANAVLSLARENRKKKQALEIAKSLSDSRGIINLGSGFRRSQTAKRIASQAALNVDITPDGTPRYRRLDLEKPLPFPDKSYSVALVSHTLEHLKNWRQCFDEARRVAEHVVVVLPHPLSLPAWLHLGHRQRFSMADIEAMGRCPNVVVLC